MKADLFYWMVGNNRGSLVELPNDWLIYTFTEISWGQTPRLISYLVHKHYTYEPWLQTAPDVEYLPRWNITRESDARCECIIPEGINVLFKLECVSRGSQASKDNGWRNPCLRDELPECTT